MEKRSLKINNYTFWIDIKYNYTIHMQDLNTPCIGGKRHTNQYRWNPKFNTYIDGKYNKECPQEIVMRAFVGLFPDVSKYYNVYNNLYNTKTSSTTVNTTQTATATTTQIDILVKALREQAEMNTKNIENLISLVTANNTPVVDNAPTVSDTDTIGNTVKTSEDNADTTDAFGMQPGEVLPLSEEDIADFIPDDYDNYDASDTYEL